MAGVIYEAGNAYPSGAPGSTSHTYWPIFVWVVHLAIGICITYICYSTNDLDVTAGTLSILIS